MQKRQRLATRCRIMPPKLAGMPGPRAGGPACGSQRHRPSFFLRRDTGHRDEVVGESSPPTRLPHGVLTIGDHNRPEIANGADMDRITLQNYRCFREKQDVALAPLTLLVGDNSTGKTSFLAIIRALWQLPSGSPSFKDDPYDLGSFDEIAHFRGGRGGRADSFEVGFDLMTTTPGSQRRRLEAVFKDIGTVAFPVARRLSMIDGHTWIKVERCASRASWQLFLGTKRGTWTYFIGPRKSAAEHFLPLDVLPWLLASNGPLYGNDNDGFTSIEGENSIDDSDWHHLQALADTSCFDCYESESLYASAPVRSRPYRTYDPSHLARDPEGDHVPLYLANMSFRTSDARWRTMKKRLEGFGKQSGLFDEIGVKRLGKRSSEPFQLQIRKYGSPAKGPMRNLIDVGYGVSQVLPVLTEMFREDGATMFLLQQPEVHLHPSAQAALGTLFSQAAANGRQLVVETHSDHLLDRVRMDVRDQATALRPEDVSILFFEKRNLGVTIHSLRIDTEGNVVDAPPSYRRFFMAETKRSLKL